MDMKDTVEPFDNSNLIKDRHFTPSLQLFLYLIPVIGSFPALWTLYHSKQQRDSSSPRERQKTPHSPLWATRWVSPTPNSELRTPNSELPSPHSPLREEREQQAVSRLSVTLAGSWLLSYVILGAGAEMWEFLTLRLLLLNSLLTSGYFLVSLWLIVRLWQRKSPRLPGFSRFADRMLGKHLS